MSKSFASPAIISFSLMFLCLDSDSPSPKPQLLLFSATVPSWVRQTADKYMSHDKVVVDLIGQQTLKTAITVEHKAICCPYLERASTIADVVQVKMHARAEKTFYTYFWGGGRHFWTISVLKNCL